LGILAGRFFAFPGLQYAAALAVVTLLLRQRSPQLALFLCLPLFFCLGTFHLLHQEKKTQHSGHIATLLQGQEHLSLVGTIHSMVEESTQHRQGEELVLSRFVLAAEEVLHQQQWRPVHGKVRVTLLGKAEGLEPGMTVLLLTRAGPAPDFTSPGAFDYQGFLAAKDIHLTAWVAHRQDIIIFSQDQQEQSRLHRLRYLPEQVRQQVGLFLRQHLPPEQAALYQALLIGSRAGVAPEVLEQFKVTGTMHLLAISGLHVGLLALMVNLLLRRLFSCSRWLLLHSHVPTLALLATLPLLFVYAFIAGMNTPVLRAVLMAALVFCAFFLRRQHSLLHLVAAAALLVLALNPLTLFTASFQLSFAAVSSIALFAPKMLPKTPKEAEEKKSALLSRYVLLPLGVSVAASLGTLPFMLLHFNRFSVIGPIMNLLIEPLLCFWALPWGLAALPCMVLAPELAVLFLQIGSLGLWAGQALIACASSRAWASVWTVRPLTGEILFYAFLVLLWYHGQRSKALLGGLALVLYFTWGLWFPPQPGISRITVLDVGQGASAFLHLPDGTRILVDAGSGRGNHRIGESVIGPYLWYQRIWRLDQALISHPHSDHFNGMEFIIRNFRPKILWINGDTHREENYQAILDLAEQLAVPESGQILAAGEDFELRVLGMIGLGPQSTDVNETSLVLRYRHGSRAVLLPGDIGKKSEELLLQQGYDLRADLLVAAHHGSSTSTGLDFLTAVQPQQIAVSAGRSSRQEHFPSAANRSLWQEQNIPVHITREQGGLGCTSDGIFFQCRGI
jgi:competence protein ComEC